MKISQICFWNRTLHVSDRFSVHHQESSIVHTAIDVCHTGYADYLLASSQNSRRNCPKHVEFYSKNKFEKLVHLVGFFIRIYHDARSSECQIPSRNFSVTKAMEKIPSWGLNIRSPVMKSLASVGTTRSLPCSEGPSSSPSHVSLISSSHPPTMFLFHLRLDLLCGYVKFSSSESISHPRYIPTVFGQLSGIRLYDKRADRKWQPIFVTYEVCPESIKPFWISREPVACPWCNFAASQKRPYCASVKSHSPVGLVSRQWAAVAWTCVMCDRRIHKSPHFQRRF